MKLFGSWFLIERGDVQIWVNDEQTALLLREDPRDQVVKKVLDLQAQGLNRHRATLKVLNDPNMAPIIEAAKRNRTGRQSVRHTTIYNWINEYLTDQMFARAERSKTDEHL